MLMLLIMGLMTLFLACSEQNNPVKQSGLAGKAMQGDCDTNGDGNVDLFEFAACNEIEVGSSGQAAPAHCDTVAQTTPADTVPWRSSFGLELSNFTIHDSLIWTSWGGKYVEFSLTLANRSNQLLLNNVVDIEVYKNGERMGDGSVKVEWGDGKYARRYGYLKPGQTFDYVGARLWLRYGLDELHWDCYRIELSAWPIREEINWSKVEEEIDWSKQEAETVREILPASTCNKWDLPKDTR